MSKRRHVLQECFEEQLVHDMLTVLVSQVVAETVEVVKNVPDW